MGESYIGETYFLIIFGLVIVAVALTEWWSGRK